MSSTYAGNPGSYPALITIPSDGDLRNALSVNAALEGLADRTAALDSQVNSINPEVVLVHWTGAHDADLGETEVAHNSPSLVWSTTSWVIGATVFTAPWATQNGDLIEAFLMGHAAVTASAGSTGWLRLESDQAATGSSEVHGAKVQFGVPGGAGTLIVPFTFHMIDLIVAAGGYVINMSGRSAVSSGVNIDWTGAWSLTVKLWRPT